MNLILLRDEDFGGDGLARLTGRRLAHVREVHRAKVGASLRVGRLGGLLGRGVVKALDEAELVLEVTLDEPPPPSPGIDLILALPRPKMFRRVLQAVTTLGVKRIDLVNSWRVEKSYFDSPHVTPEAITEELLLGLEQARDTVLPEVVIHRLFVPFVEKIVPLHHAASRRLVADPTTPRTLADCEAGTPPTKAVIAIGPEGGWVRTELESLNRAGFQPFSLGPRILRVDTAVPLLLGQLELARGKRDERAPLSS